MSIAGMTPTQMVQPQPPAQTTSGASQRAVAPAWHTVVVLIVLLGFSLAGALGTNRMLTSGAHGRVYTYLLVIAFEWVLVAFIWFGVSRRGVTMSELVGGSWPRPAVFFRDLGIAVAFLIVCGLGVVNGLGYLLKAAPPQVMRNVFPHGPTEIVLWLLMSLNAGFCEEVIFRGYLQRQLAALTQAAAGGIVLQGIAFGLGHGYQGWKLMLIISVYGVLFGLLARWRRSLRPGMITHFVQDGLGGLLARYLVG